MEQKQVAQQQAERARYLVLKAPSLSTGLVQWHPFWAAALLRRQAQEEKKRTIIHAEGEKEMLPQMIPSLLAIGQKPKQVRALAEASSDLSLLRSARMIGDAIKAGRLIARRLQVVEHGVVLPSPMHLLEASSSISPASQAKFIHLLHEAFNPTFSRPQDRKLVDTTCSPRSA